MHPSCLRPMTSVWMRIRPNRATADATVTETIRQNPIPAAIAAAGLALLWMNRSNGSSNGYRRDQDREGRSYDYRAYDAGSGGPGITD